jgi:hypothetical protein
MSSKERLYREGARLLRVGWIMAAIYGATWTFGRLARGIQVAIGAWEEMRVPTVERTPERTPEQEAMMRRSPGRGGRGA